MGEAVGGFVLLFACLSGISCLFPVTGPRLAQRVALTPLVSAASAVVLAPAISVLALTLAAIPVIVMTDDRSTRRQALGRFLLLALSQMTAAYAMTRVGALPIGTSLPFGLALCRCLAVVVVYGAVFLIVLAIRSGARRPRAAGSSQFSTGERWSTCWSNEGSVYLAGAAPTALIAALMLGGHGLLGAAISIPAAVVLGLLSRAMIERKMMARQVRSMQELTETAALAGTPKILNLLDEFLRHSRSFVLYDRARIWIYDEDDTVLVEARSLPPTNPAIDDPAIRRFGEDLVGRVAERQTPMIVADIRRDPRHCASRLSGRQKLTMGPVSQLLLPMTAGGELIGVVEFERDAWAAFRQADRERLGSLTTLAAMGVANIRRHNDICRLAVTDGLTGLYNKRHISQLLYEEVRRSDRYGHSVSVLMMDLDNFKSYNDTYGHPQGDVLLHQVARIIQQAVRTSDSVGRYGGEEFMVVMPETSPAAARATAERIRRTIETTPFPGKPSLPASLPDDSLADCYPETEENWVTRTISIGVASFPSDAGESGMLVAMADNALYDAKRAGRNCVVAAGEQATRVAA